MHVIWQSIGHVMSNDVSNITGGEAFRRRPSCLKVGLSAFLRLAEKYPFSTFLFISSRIVAVQISPFSIGILCVYVCVCARVCVCFVGWGGGGGGGIISLISFL